MKSMPPCHAALMVPPGLPVVLPVAPVLTVLAPPLLLLPQPDAPSNTTPSATAPSAIHIPGRLMRFLSLCVSGARWLTETPPIHVGRRHGRRKVSCGTRGPGLVRAARIERVAQAVAQQVERERREQDAQARPHHQPGDGRVVVHGRVDQVAPAGLALRDADAQVREAG